MEINQQNIQALRNLKNLGYPLPAIRKAFHKLTGIDQPEMARRLDITRISITQHIIGNRRNPSTQQKIASMWGVPAEELFNRPYDGGGQSSDNGEKNEG